MTTFEDLYQIKETISGYESNRERRQRNVELQDCTAFAKLVCDHAYNFIKGNHIFFSLFL